MVIGTISLPDYYRRYRIHCLGRFVQEEAGFPPLHASHQNRAGYNGSSSDYQHHTLYLMERNNIFSGNEWFGVLSGLFLQRGHTRTAGFNNVDTAALTDGSKFLSAIPHVYRRKPGLHGRRYQDQHPGSASALRPFQYPPDIRGWRYSGRRLEDESIRQSACIPDHQPGSDAGSHHSHYGVPEPAYVGCVL